ncbi:MAG TPA: hypothetical protein VKX16_07890 [Chloroflexota bacterium]|nr:hypothetical protein [Chloroflexota bacterium]
MSQVIATSDPTKIVFRVTGHGPLAITAIGPGGQVRAPDWLEAHDGSSLDGVVPGDEWGSGWTFPSNGCWDLHAVRDGIQGDIYFETAVPRLVDMTLSIVSKRPTYSGQRIVFSVRTVLQPFGHASLSGRITIRHGGNTVRVLTLHGDTLNPMRASTRLTVNSSTWFRAVARLRLGQSSLVRTIRFKVVARQG